MAEKNASRKTKKDDPLEAKTGPDNLPTWPELTLLIEKTVSQAVSSAVSSAVSTAVTKAVTEVMANIHSELANVNTHLSTLEGKFMSFTSELASTTTNHSNRLCKLEEELILIQQIDEGVKNSEESIHRLQIENKRLIKMNNDLDQMSRNHNLRITRLAVHPQSVTDEVITFIHEKMNQTDISALDISNVSILRKSSASLHHPQQLSTSSTIIVSFVRKAVRDRILRSRRNLKGTHIGITEDLTTANAQFLSTHRKDPRLKNIWSWNGKLYFISTKDEKKRIATPFVSLDQQLPEYLTSSISHHGEVNT